MVFFEGYAVGLALIVLVGPVLFVLTGETLEHGRRSGFAVATGIFVSDIIAVVLCTVGVANYLTDSEVTPWLAGSGGLMLLILGFGYIIKKPLLNSKKIEGSAGVIKMFSKGFLVNFVNPFVFFVWLGIIAAGSSRHGTGYNLYIYMTGSVLAVFTLDILKVFFASHIKIFLKPGKLKAVYTISGIIMSGFGIRLIFTGITL